MESDVTTKAFCRSLMTCALVTIHPFDFTIMPEPCVRLYRSSGPLVPPLSSLPIMPTTEGVILLIIPGTGSSADVEFLILSLWVMVAALTVLVVSPNA
ncbi:hypothetical protein D3C78_1413810 [compost metagenome]